MSDPSNAWPELPLDAWSDTCATLHLWTQIVGKVRLALMPWINHSWHVTLYVTPRGLTTSAMPFGTGAFQIDFDFIEHALRIAAADGRSANFQLEPQSVAAFHSRLFEALRALDIAISINTIPSEIANAIPFDRDEVHRAYDADYAARYWRILLQAARVMTVFRARFVGKCSPVHYFWGAPDLAVTRFSGRAAPTHPGGIPNLPDRVAQDAYSREVSSCGFWPGGGPVPYAAFYSYAYPEPAGFSAARVQPSAAFYSTDLREFILPYDAVRLASTPDDMLLEFLQSTYEAAANLGSWDRPLLEA
jgi:hypothetical protein